MTASRNLARSPQVADLGVDAHDIEEIVARSPVATCVATSDAGVLLANDAASRLLGVPLDALLGRRLIDTFVHPDDVASVEWVGDVVRGGSTVDVRHRLLTASEDERHVRASISPIMRDGVVRYAVAQYVDETELVVAMRAVEHQGERLRRFAEIVAHDLRSPVAEIATAAGLLTEGPLAASGESLAVVRIIESASHEAAIVVERTLSQSLAEVEGGDEAVDLVAIVSRVKALLGPALAKVGGQVLVAGSARVIHMDGERLREILHNLCDNAVKYRGDRPLRIVVEADAAEQRLSVIDNGRGMTAEQRARVLERGFQIDSAERGSGLGLARVTELVQSAGGTISVAAGSGEGTAIDLRLPGRVGVEAGASFSRTRPRPSAPWRRAVPDRPGPGTTPHPGA